MERSDRTNAVVKSMSPTFGSHGLITMRLHEQAAAFLCLLRSTRDRSENRVDVWDILHDLDSPRQRVPLGDDCSSPGA